MDTEDELEILDAATRRYQRTEKAHKESRKAALDAVIAALKAGKKPAEVERRSPFTGAYIRKVAREQGIPPDARYVRTGSGKGAPTE
jgi:hypothetical protein